SMGDPDLNVEVEFKEDTFPIPFDGPRESPVVDAIAGGHQLVRGAAPGESEVLKFAASDASWLADAGIPGIIYGPTGRYLSRPDERCETADLVDAAKVYAYTIARLCA
ncbi:MAG: M20/M25/M40 family metallo-hydrolase, partial [Bauldia litoralis]